MRFSKSSLDRFRSGRAFAHVVVLVLCAGTACGAPPRNESRTESSPYRAFYGGAGSGATERRGTLVGDYQWAAGSATGQEAVLRWKEFLKTHQPADGEYQDGFQRNYIRSALYELMRAEYLTGNAAEGDRLLTELEDVRGKQ